MNKVIGTVKKQIILDEEIITNEFDVECSIIRVLEKDKQTEVLLRISDKQSFIEETLLINGLIDKMDGLVIYLNKIEDFNVYLSD